MNPLTRRELFKAAMAGMAGATASGWLSELAARAANHPARRRQCILLWMPGGPSQTDTFDMKPRHANGGEFREIATSIPGLGISEHLPKLAAQAEHLAIIRSLSTKEGDHGRGTFLMRTGHQPGGPIKYPSLGSSLSKTLGSDDAQLPNYVSISPYTLFNTAAFGPGFLGPRYAPLTVGSADGGGPAGDGPNRRGRYAELGVDDLHPPRGVGRAQDDGRLSLWRHLASDFAADHRAAASLAHQTVYERAVRMMRSEAARAFDLSDEPREVRDAYGRGRFGQGCLMARRLIERGVPFVEVALGGQGGNALGWDTHQDNFRIVRNLCGELDAGWGTLMTELSERGLLTSTTILWMGEFGRTPKINGMAGRDHFPAAWSCVLAGGGVHGGQAYGRTSADGTTVEDGKVDVGDVLATLCAALGLDPG
ncbi:MAG: DUF1501 domain-containing protein, partial [Pirellulales bacterium]